MPDSTLPALAAAPDAELQNLLTNAASLDAFDAFFTRGVSLQTRADASMDEEARVSAARSLAADSRAVFALFQRVTQSAALLSLAEDCGLLHVTRVAPFCQIYAPKNAAAVGVILDSLVENVPAFSTALSALRQLYIRQLSNFNKTVQQVNRGQVVQLLHVGYELSLSVAGLCSADSVAQRLLLAGADMETELAQHEASVLYGLVQLYEAALPALQRQVLSLDDKVQAQEAALIAETRHTLLQVLARCVDLLMETQEGEGSGTGEELLAGLHALSNGCLDDEAEHGSFLSDLWYLGEYKDKVAEFFDRCKLDVETFSYLDMVVEGLPRRRVLLADDLAAEAKPKASLSADAKEWGVPVEEETKPAAPQKDDTEAVLAPMVLQVKDFFPDLGDGYVELCLLSSNLQVEVVINFLLESNPPPVLIDVAQGLKRSDPEFVQLEAQITGKPAPAPKVEESKKLDPSRVWVGKKTVEKTYDPQIAKKDQQLVEKMKQLVSMYEEEDEHGDLPSGEGAYGGRDDGITLDEYDDDYNDEFDDFVSFSIRDGGSVDDQDAIREQNRRMRLKEEKDAFWEGMRNRNRETPLSADHEEEEEKEGVQSAEQRPSRPSSAGGPSQGPSGPKHKSTRRQDKRQGEEKKQDEPLTPQQIQRQRARKDKNKAKVANHNRKDRAMKKMG
ncbi:hypothetical protein PF005_g12112 [Phytophthora fragariae]|uniref:CUE domain-containing protein n=1 Tax=Phytophthora fragariae TaxID=53985 RepID=A0A6A3EJF3_9STRA|nr:hypothetical protein PF009_g16172 [Phytophthora fragariae]KAE9008231.1 hypothetical protein PF011_g10790 [Phytophthora fragariae]KAE9109521.1 hypothetical protein PF007_g12217 [Phytophthora fragariae]KAE9143627.1 hypothetical protein PF006_g11360 [Phytophthora fragariae]KAE9208706.1 hypothetical protein PF005_g12112 [Phytophthora fragariae]